MDIRKVGKRGVLFNYEEGDCPIGGGTSVYLINTKNKLFLCDTHMGAKSMDVVKEYINDNNLDSKELIIFNSHSDWDHIWGNCAFESESIIGHVKCRELMQETAGFTLDKLGKYKNGDVELKYPDITFENKLSFNEEGIEFIYAPGHTQCSAICYDKIDGVVFVGDLVEEPYPVLNYGDWNTYIKSLEYIKSLNADIIVTSHSQIVEEDVVNDNIKYISDFIKCYKSSDTSILANQEIERDYNRSMNVKLMQQYEQIIKKKLGEQFDYKKYKKDFWSIIGLKYEDLDKEYIHTQKLKPKELIKIYEKFLENC